MHLLTPLKTAALCLGLAAVDAHGATTSVELVSAGKIPPQTGSGHSLNPAFSGDGRFITFVSQAQNLVTNGSPSRFLNACVHDLESQTTSLVSVNSSGRGGGNEDSNYPTISSNGQFVAFSSYASNLVPGDTNGVLDVFVRDLVSHTTSLVSANISGGFSRRASGVPVISANGQRVVFQSGATDLVTNSFSPGGNHLFFRDMSSGKTGLITVNPRSNFGAMNPGGVLVSDSASISADGRYVAFFSTAIDLIANLNLFGRRGDIFIRDLDQSSTVWASSGATNLLPNGSADYSLDSPQLSSDGSVVVFLALSIAQPPALISFNRLTGSSTLVSTNVVSSGPPKISADGRLVTYQTGNEIWLTDLTTGLNELVCGTNSIPGVVTCAAPDISADGQRVVFRGAASTNGPWSAYRYDRTTGARDVVSLNTNGAPADVGEKSEPAISPDGERVAFESERSDLVSNDANNASDVFARDLPAARTWLISEMVGPAVTGPLGHGSRAQIGSMSQHGRHVAFASLNNQLTPGDDNVWQDIFLVDRVAGTNQLVRYSDLPNQTRLAFAPALSTNGRYVAWFEQPVGTDRTTNICWLDRETGAKQTIGFAGTSYPSVPPALSPDGRWIAFTERTAIGGFTNIYLRDLWSSNPSNELVSVNRLGTGGGAGHSILPKFSPDGRWLLFFSHAADLVTNQLGLQSFPFPQIFARDLQSDITRWISSPWGGSFREPRYPIRADVTKDNHFVLIESSSSQSVLGGLVFKFDLASTNGISQICSTCFNPNSSADGRIIAYEQRDGWSRTQIFVQDTLAQQALLVSSNALPSATPGGNGNSFSPLVTADGRYVIFASRATNLVADDINGATDIFVHDRTLRSTFLLSRSADGIVGTGPSTLPVLAPDGRTILFTSFADNLASGDLNNARDVFVVRLGGPDTDADGLDDEWELSYFNNLKTDGTLDSDNDGAIDVEEYRAGTNPISSSSVLRVLSSSYTLGNTMIIVWNSEPGTRYRLQYKRNVNDLFWLDLPGIVTANGTTATQSDSTATGEARRFYRVVIEP